MTQRGFGIADKIKTRFLDKVQLIGFDIDTYYQNLSDVKLSKERIHKLDRIQNKELLEVSEAIKKEKRASYEELKIEAILKRILHNI